MDRRWFLGKVGAFFGAATAVAAGVKDPAKVEIANPQIITPNGIQSLCHVMADAKPINGKRGFSAGCIWQDVRDAEAWVNTGSYDSPVWTQVHDVRKFIKYVTNQRLMDMPTGISYG